MYETLYEKGLLKVVASLPDLEEETEKLKQWDPNILERASNLLKYKEGELNVLNHGDLWICNILFKSESEDSLDMRMVRYYIFASQLELKRAKSILAGFSI